MPVFSKEKSKFKLVIYFEDGGAARFYSVIKENRKKDGLVVEKMTRRILSNKYDFQFRYAIFYDNKTDEPFKTVIGSQFKEKNQKNDAFDPDNSLVKAIMIGLDHRPKVFYSRQEEEKNLAYDPLDIKEAMRKRLDSKFRYKSLKFEFR